MGANQVKGDNPYKEDLVVDTVAFHCKDPSALTKA